MEVRRVNDMVMDVMLVLKRLCPGWFDFHQMREVLSKNKHFMMSWVGNAILHVI